MSEDKVFLTKEGLEALKKEYRELLEIKRPKIVDRLSEARQAGDLAENSEYSQAKEELSFIDGQIREIEEVINKAVLIEENHGKCQTVTLGCKVTVKLSDGSQKAFRLVGEWEADPVSQKISYSSPLGKSLLGKRVGNIVEVEVPAGKIIYTIVEIGN